MKMILGWFFGGAKSKKKVQKEEPKTETAEERAAREKRENTPEPPEGISDGFRNILLLWFLCLIALCALILFPTQIKGFFGW